MQKKEIDIVIYKDCNENSEKYAIELKYPTNGAYPRRMFQCIEDIKFMEQVLEVPKNPDTVWKIELESLYRNHQGKL